MKKLFFYFLLFLSAFTYATHNRAGEILYTRIAPFTAVVGGLTVQVYNYKFTIITYTDDGNGIADRCEDTLEFGDGTKGIAKRVNGLGGSCNCGPGIGCGVVIINDPGYRVKKNVYECTHSYAGPGNYLVRMFDPNRNAGVINIPNSVNQPFYLESWLKITSFIGANSSPEFGFDPTDRACVGKCFYHNPGAYDPDGDSLSFQITYSRGENGAIVPGYQYPSPGPGGTYGIHPTNGILTWCVPQVQGEYNLAFIVYEWRKNTSGIYEIVGYVLRDMQVIVKPCPNVNSPDILLPADTCVEAGTFINKTITVSDPDNDTVTLTGEGGAFGAVSPAAYITNTSAQATYTSAIKWQTTCDHIRQQPYINILKAEDQTAPPKLIYFTSYNIKVVPPSVKNVSATPIGSTIKLTWNFATCNPTNNPVVKYEVYRKEDCSPFTYNPCDTRISPASGFTLVGQTTPSNNSFIDNNGGNGLVVGQDYSYLVVAVYYDGSVSYGSNQVCARLKRDVPVLLNVDVLSTSASTGSVYVRWTRPLKTSGNFDTLVFPGPYQFNLKHRVGSGAYTTVFNTTKPLLYQLDTDYVHTSLNTSADQHEYIVEFIAGTVTIGSSQKATSVYLNATGNDRRINLAWGQVVPWNNYKYTVSRKDPGSSTFTVIGTTTLTTYSDTVNVVNRATYCYKILSEGKYSDTTIYHPLLNNSEEMCATALDLTPPCTPTIEITDDCPAGFLEIKWNDVTKSCSDDVIKYILFKKETIDDEYVQVATINSPTITSFTFDGLDFINSCFAIQSVDSSGNMSQLSPDYCVDNCPEFELPNIISLNNDGVNDFFKAIKVRQIKQIELYVYDRWGNMVYKTTDPYFKWDGVSIQSGKTVSEGTFFYICDVYEPRVSGIKKRNLKGYLEVVK